MMQPVAAAVSSLFPNYVLGPWLVCDYQNVPRRMDSRPVRVAVGAAALLAFNPQFIFITASVNNDILAEIR